MFKVEIIKGGPVTYCQKCNRKKYSSHCKCNKIPPKIAIVEKEN